MIINIRGTHGSGKSHIIRTLLRLYIHEPTDTNSRGQPNNYLVRSPVGPLYVVGNYTNACGGCDAIQPYSEIWPRVERFAELGHVVFEGALISSSYGNIGRDSEKYGDDFVFAFLNTPLEVCVERIRQRRLAKGNTKPLDPRNTEFKYNGIAKSIPKIRDEFKRRVVILDYKTPIIQLLKLWRNG